VLCKSILKKRDLLMMTQLVSYFFVLEFNDL
jgi:hypothetical protein